MKAIALLCSTGLVAGLPSIAMHGQTNRLTTFTTATSETREVAGHTVATITVTSTDEEGKPAAGIVSLQDLALQDRTMPNRPHGLASAALNTEGIAIIKLDNLSEGDHAISAIYAGDAAHAPSHSQSLTVHPEASTNPDFQLTTDPVAPVTLTVAAPGDTASLIATVTPINGFTGFLSLSCSGPSVSSGAPGGSALPFGVSCTYSPANLEVTATTTANPTGSQSANLTIQTTAPSGSTAQNRPQNGVSGSSKGSPLVLAVLLPGVLGLGFLARKQNALRRAALLLLTAVTLLGASACSPRYKYFHHPPTYNPGTTAGTYTITVTAQTSNGVTATEHSNTLTLVVK